MASLTYKRDPRTGLPVSVPITDPRNPLNTQHKYIQYPQPAGPPSPMPKYRDWLKGRASTSALAMQYAKAVQDQTGNGNMLLRLQAIGKPIQGPPAPTTPAPAVATPAPAVDPASQIPTGGSVAAPDTSTTMNDAAAGNPMPDVTRFTQNTGQLLPMPKTVPTVNINQLYAPAERMIASQRAAALAAQDKAFQDNMAFEQFMQNATTQGNQALAGTMGQLSSAAQQSRQQSIDSINSTIGQMNLGAGGNSDLANLAGSTAAGQSNQLLQAGQSAQNAVPDLVGQAQLNYAKAQSGVAGAQGRVMNDAAIRATQAALGQTADQQTQLETSKAAAGIQQASGLRDYMIQAAQLDALNKFNAGKLTEQGYDSYSRYLGQIANAKAKIDVAKIKSDTSLSVADRNNLTKLAVVHNQQVGATNRTLLKGKFNLQAAAARAATSKNFPSAATTLISNALRNTTQTYQSMSRADKGQLAQQLMAQVATSYGANAQRPNGLTFDQAKQIAASSFPGSAKDILIDPKFINFLKGQFPS